jgi:signal peptidase II
MDIPQTRKARLWAMSSPSSGTRLNAAPRRLAVGVPLTITALLLLADQLLKAWALSNLQGTVCTALPCPPAIPFVPGLVSWSLTYNTGAAWSLFSGSALPLAIGRLLVGLGILVYLWRRPQQRALSVVLAMISAGAIGNSVDGIRFGRVTDMIVSPALSAVTRAVGAGEFPTFNIADSCVVVGTILLVLLSFRKPG